jgi:GDP-D-mannose dehydratase
MLFCEVCLVEFNSQIPFQEHLVSNNHLNATRFQEAIKSKKFERPYEVIKISGNNKKLIQTINYQPKILIKEIVNKMILKKF